MTAQNPVPPRHKDVSVPLESIIQSAKWITLMLLLVPLAVYWLLHGFQHMFNFGMPRLQVVLILLAAFLMGIVIHEGLHAIGWMTFGRFSWREIRFGIDTKTLSPYTHAQVHMTATAYRIGAAIPGIITGLLPALVGIVLADGMVTLFGATMLSAAVGDVLVLWIIRDVPGNALVLDHPTQAGCMVKIGNA